jgi:hypothetical protein
MLRRQVVAQAGPILGSGQPPATQARGPASTNPCAKRRPGRPSCGRSTGLSPGRPWYCRQPLPKPPREPPLRFAFFIRPSYWCDIRWAWIWAVKSITTTTTISSEVPPK